MGQGTHGTCFANKSKYQILPHPSTWLPKYSNNLTTTQSFPGLLSRVMKLVTIDTQQHSSKTLFYKTEMEGSAVFHMSAFVLCPSIVCWQLAYLLWIAGRVGQFWFKHEPQELSHRNVASRLVLLVLLEVVQVLAPQGSPGSLTEMQNAKPQPRPTESESTF